MAARSGLPPTRGSSSPRGSGSAGPACRTSRSATSAWSWSSRRTPPPTTASAPPPFSSPATPSPPPPGRRDLDLVADALAPGETTRLPGSDAPTLLFVTEGTLRVEPADGRRLALVSGDAQVVAGPLEITATGRAPTRVVAAVIGPEVAAAGAAVVAPPSPAATGAISFAPYACPAGMRPETIDPAACSPAPDVMALQTFVLGGGDNRRSLADATVSRGVFTWDGLPFGDYVIQATDLAPGYDRYLIPGLGGLNEGAAPPERGYTVSPNEGHLLPLGPTAPTSAAPATVGLFLHACPPGVAAAPDLRSAGCDGIDPITVGFDVRLTSDALPRPLTLADAAPAVAAGYAWNGLPLAAYTVTVILPPGLRRLRPPLLPPRPSGHPSPRPHRLRLHPRRPPPRQPRSLPPHRLTTPPPAAPRPPTV